MNLLFDFDGTLFDYDKAIRDILVEMCQILSIDYKGNISKDFKIITKSILKHNSQNNIFSFNTLRFKILFREYKHISIKEAIRLFLFLRQDTIRLFDDTVYILRVLSKKNKIIITSNGVFQVQSVLIKKAGLDKYISGLVTSDIINIKKPNVDFLIKTFELFNLKPASTLLVGDSFEEDILCAYKMGIKSYLLDRKNRLETNLNNIYNCNIIKNLSQIVYFLNR